MGYVHRFLYTKTLRWCGKLEIGMTDKKSICVISGTFHPEVGGPATYLYHLCRVLVERGHKIHVITYGDDVEDNRYLYPVTRISRQLIPPVRLGLFFYKVITIGRNYDLLYVNDYGLPPALANLFLKKRIVMKIVGDFAWEYSRRNGLICDGIDEFQNRSYSPKVWLLKQIQAFYSCRADTVIVPSRYLKGIVSQWGCSPNRIRVIYNAIDLGRLDSKIEKNQVREQLHLKGKIIVTIARLAPWKGIDILIQSFAQIKDTDVRLLVVGSGPELEKLMKMCAALEIEDRVTFTEEVPNEDVQKILKASDLFVLNSSYEGLPHVLLEAMACGVPIIATNSGGNREVIVDGNNGRLVRYGDVEELAYRIEEVLGDHESREQYIRRSYERLKMFNWDNLLRDTVEVLMA